MQSEARPQQLSGPEGIFWNEAKQAKLPEGLPDGQVQRSHEGWHGSERYGPDKNPDGKLAVWELSRARLRTKEEGRRFTFGFGNQSRRRG